MFRIDHITNQLHGAASFLRN